jgi:hypothetical protein
MLKLNSMGFRISADLYNPIPQSDFFYLDYEVTCGDASSISMTILRNATLFNKFIK